MKKLLLFLILLVSTVTTNAQKASEGRSQDNRILKQLQADMVKDPVYLKGNLATWVNAANEFVVYAETPERKYLFVLQMEKARTIKGKFTDLTFIGDAMVLNDGKANYYFGIIPVSENKVLAQAHLTETDFVNIVMGYGLARYALDLDDKRVTPDKLKGAKSVSEYLEAKKK